MDVLHLLDFRQVENSDLVKDNSPEHGNLDTSSDNRATVKREDGPWVEPPAALDL